VSGAPRPDEVELPLAAAVETPRARGRAEQHCAGGLVVRDAQVLLISPREGRWQLPKGHLEPGEGPTQAAVREVREETGVQGRIVAVLPSITYSYATAKGAQVRKRVDYYLMSYESGSERDSDPREVLQARWWSWDQALSMLSFDNERQVAEQARRHTLAEEGG
jgi:8-oxo-dGTP pyrophosphatase MutT (NUDIX family)